jgi:TusA-related sulfurtransferase
MKVVLAMLLVAACARDENNNQSGSPSEPAPAATLTGKLPRKMRNCPSAVPGTTTRAIDTSKGVDLEVTNDDPAARREIVARAELQSTQTGPRWFMPAHSGMHGGPGTIGHCPVMHANTDVTYDQMAGGVRIHILARDKVQIPVLQQAVHARTQALAPQS